MLLLIFKLSSLCLDFIQQIFTEHTHCTSGTVLDSRINAEWDTSSHLWGEEIDSPLGWVNCKWMWLVLMSKEVMCYGPMLTSALFTTARTWKQPKWPSMDEWIKKKWYKHTRLYYSAMKENSIMPFAATWMNLEIIILSEVSQTEKDKYHMILLICGI